MLFRVMLVFAVCGLASGCGMPTFTAKQDVEQSIPLEGQKNLEVSTFNGSLQVTETSGNEIELVAHITSCGYTQQEADAGLAALEPKLMTDTGTIQVIVHRDKKYNSWSNGVELELKVPRRMKVKLTTSNGTISCIGRDSDVEAKTSNGEIKLKDIHADVKAKSSNGKIQAELVQGTVQLDTSNGFIKLNDCKLIGDNQLETSNGSVVVTLSPQSPIDFTAKTSNGDVKCEVKESQVTQEKSSRMQGVLFPSSEQEPPKTKLVIRTSNGNVTLEELPAKPSAPADSSVGTGDEIPKSGA